MVVDMFAYLAWIVMVFGGIAVMLHILESDRPVQVRVPVERTYRK